MTQQAEIEQRYAAVREAAQAADVDAVVVSGSEYTGFEGAVRYLSGFRILHRYAYVVVPVEGDPAVVFPKEARWVGDHGEAWMEQVFADHPGGWIADRARANGWRRIGVSGLDYVMAVRDYRALADGPAEIVPFDEQFDLARAVKSEAEIESVREGMRINEAGVEAVLQAYELGKTEAELMAEAERVFTAAGCYRTTMDMIIGGPEGAAYPEFRFPSEQKRVGKNDLLLYGLEIAGPGGHWVEFSRPICAGQASAETLEAMDAYHEYSAAARATMRAGATAHDVHRAVSKGFVDRGFQLGHVTGHSIGMTMIEHPRIGEGNETMLRENMVVSMHPHAYTPDERTCLYMQDTWLVTADGGVPFSDVPLRIYDGSETGL
ncbi:MAG TPA: M24 family metallopeptidase [Gaiellaceae bacterium]|nr:M24 family metallopeptidase [Gaiellaceae bacterium]